jgi:hypothetical protein
MKTITTALLALTAPVVLTANSLTVSIDSLTDPTTFEVAPGSSIDFRYAELIGASANTATHILIEGLIPLEDGGLSYASPYVAVNSGTGAEEDSGIVLMDLPQAVTVPEGSVSSPIVGIIERPQSWDNYTPVLPQSTLGGASGDGSFATEGSLELTLVRGADTFTGTATYTVVDTSTIELDPFTLVNGGTSSTQLSGATLVRDGSVFSGVVTNQEASAPFDSLMFKVVLSGIPDVDGDQIPDIVDDSVEAGGLIVGEFNFTALGYVDGITPDWGYSFVYNYVYVTLDPWFYQFYVGWMYLVDTPSPTARWFYSPDPDLGWMYVEDSWNGGYLKQIVGPDTGVFVPNGFFTP